MPNAESIRLTSRASASRVTATYAAVFVIFKLVSTFAKNASGAFGIYMCAVNASKTRTRSTIQCLNNKPDQPRSSGRQPWAGRYHGDKQEADERRGKQVRQERAAHLLLPQVAHAAREHDEVHAWEQTAAATRANGHPSAIKHVRFGGPARTVDERLQERPSELGSRDWDDHCSVCRDAAIAVVVSVSQAGVSAGCALPTVRGSRLYKAPLHSKKAPRGPMTPHLAPHSHCAWVV